MDNIIFNLVEKNTRGETEFYQYTRLRNQLVIAAEKFYWEGNLSPGQMPTMSKDMEEQIERAQKLVDVVDLSNKKIGVTRATLLQYKVDKHDSYWAEVRLVLRKKDDDKMSMWTVDLKNSVIYST